MGEGASRLGEPGPGSIDLGSVEVLDLGHGEWLAHRGHPFLPCLLADQRDAFDVEAVLGGKLDVVPQGVHVPAVEIVELSQQADLPVFGHCGLDRRDEVLVILIVELARQLESEDLVGFRRQLLDHGAYLRCG